MEFLSNALLLLAAVIFIAGIMAISKEQKKYINRPADWHFKRKELIRNMSVITAICLIGACWASPAKKETSSNAQVAQKPSVSDTTSPVNPADTLFGSNWKYGEEVDPMTSATEYYAHLQSPSILDLKFPYDGGVTPSLTLRYKSHQNRVYLSVDKGQFLTSSDGGEIKVKFDDGKPQIFECSEPNDGSSNTLFINEESRFIAKLKHSKSLMIQAIFYNNGSQTMEFGTQLLKWNH